jgi:hypothetical protein
MEKNNKNLEIASEPVARIPKYSNNVNIGMVNEHKT